MNKEYYTFKNRSLEPLLQLKTIFKNWPDPTEDMVKTREFEAIWEVIKSWDINVPGIYNGYMGATGNHVKAILDSLYKHQEGQLQILLNLLDEAYSPKVQFTGNREHSTIHGSLNKCVEDLIGRGILEFDTLTKTYQVGK